MQFPLFVFASENGKYYVCDTTILKEKNECIFKETSDAPFDTAAPHNIVRGKDQYRQVVTAKGDALMVTPKPWTNGDNFLDTNKIVTGDLWNYALAFDLVAPLRDVMMYTPSVVANNKTKWDIYTKAFTDCGIKTEDAQGDHGIALSTANVYQKLKDPAGKDIHHNILQYLEEGAIDLVCLVTSLDMPVRCNPIREKWAASIDTSCNCFFDAYEAMYGVQPNLGDNKFTNCSYSPPPPFEPSASPKILNVLESISLIMLLGTLLIKI